MIRKQHAVFLLLMVSLLSLHLHSTCQAADGLRERVEQLINSEKFDDALKECRDEFEKQSRSHAPNDPSVLEAAGILGSCELLMGHPREAESVLGGAALKATEAGRPESAAAAHLANELGVACYQLARFKESKQWLARAVEIRKRLLGAQDIDTLQSIRNLAYAEDAVGNHQQSKDLFNQCYAGLEVAIQSPQVRVPSSSEAVVITEWKPHYPRVVIDAFTGAPGQGTKFPALVKPKNPAGWIMALSQLHVLQQRLKSEYRPYGRAAAEHAGSTFGDRNYKTFLILTNVESGLIPRPDLVPAPFGPFHHVMASIYLRNAIAHQNNFGQQQNLFFVTDPGREAIIAAKIREGTLGRQHPLFAAAIEVQGLLKQESGDLEAAIEDFKNALSIRNDSLGADHPLTGTSLATLGVAYYSRGDVGLSRTCLDKSLSIYRQKLGPADSSTAAVASDLASVARRQGEYALSRKLLEEAIVILKDAAPTDAYAKYAFQTASGNLAVIQMELGDLESANKYFLNLLESPNSMDKGRAELHLAIIARFRGQTQDAERYLKSLLAREPKNLAAVHQLGALYRDLGDIKQAKLLLGNLLQARLQDPQANLRPETALAISSAGLLSLDEGKPDEAALFLSQSYFILKSQLGSTSKQTAEVLRQLGIAYLQSGKLSQARQCLEDALNVKSRWSDEQLPYLAEADAVQFAASLGELDPLLSALRLDPASTPEDAYRAVWTAKAAATRAIASKKSLRVDTPKGRVLTAQLRMVRSKLAKMIQSREVVDKHWQPLAESTNGPKLSIFQGRIPPTKAEFDAMILELTLEKERLERELATVEPQFSRQRVAFAGSPAGLLAKLPRDVAVIDIVRVKAWNRDPQGTIKKDPEEIYEAFILKSSQNATTSPITRVNLGPVGPIDGAVAQWRAQFSGATAADRGLIRQHLKDENSTTIVRPDQVLRTQLWDKLAPSLSGIETCIVIPEGDLVRLSWGAIPGQKPGTFLIEEMNFATASYGQQLLAMFDSKPVKEGNTLLVGGVTYDATIPSLPISAIAASETRSYRSVTDTGLRSGWSNLPGTVEEISEILSVRKGNSVILSRTSATKSAVIEAMPKSRFIHLATHGFFSQEPVNSVLSVRGRATTVNGLPLNPGYNTAAFETPLQVESLVGRNPLVLSGVVFAGANAPDAFGSDSILTAEELVDLDLGETELVTLSACETGLGATAGGEGVFGLQRALAIAGARSSIASLWQVDDAATKALMVEFYRNLWEKKMSRSQALREAQLRMLRGELTMQTEKDSMKKHVSPFYWAAFVLSGDWR